MKRKDPMQQNKNPKDDGFDEAMERTNAIWSFQQDTIPRLAFDLGSRFFDGLDSGFHILVVSAAGSFGEKFANELAVSATSDPEGYLIDFGPPEEPTLSRFIFIPTASTSPGVFFLELSQRGAFMICEKQPDGCHRNHGRTTVRTAKGFIAKIRRLMKSTPAVQPSASQRHATDSSARDSRG